MGRFIQQQIKTFVSRFIPAALCPSCGKTSKVQKSTPKVVKSPSGVEIRKKTAKSTPKKQEI